MSAWDDCEEAAEAAGVDVRLLDAAGRAEASALWATIWDDPVLEPHMLTALAHSGNYVGGAYSGDTLVGAAAGFFSQPVGRAMHSHVAGIARSHSGTGVGTALKLHQRAWCLDLGVSEMTWTFDPLVLRNAVFNVSRLGASIDEYHPRHYGAMTDGVNAGDESDRIVVRWHLGAPLPTGPHPVPSATHAALRLTADGTPASAAIPDDARAVTLAVPEDIEALRRADAVTALAWRRALREAMVPLLSTGWTVTAVTRDTGYLLERTP